MDTKNREHLADYVTSALKAAIMGATDGIKPPATSVRDCVLLSITEFFDANAIGVVPTEGKIHLPEVTLFIQCSDCVDELPEGQSSEEYGRQETALTTTGILVGCLRHEQVVIHFTPAELQKRIDSPPDCGRCGHEH